MKLQKKPFFFTINYKNKKFIEIFKWRKRYIQMFTNYEFKAKLIKYEDLIWKNLDLIGNLNQELIIEILNDKKNA